MSETHTVWIDWEIAPFHRRWLGWSRVLWWAWPVRWMFVREGGREFRRVTDYHVTAREAACAMTKWCMENADRETPSGAGG